MAPTSTAPSSSRDWHALSPALSPWILDAMSSMGFDRMTPVQANAIPLFMGNKDVVVEAVTGSGKTLAFLIPAVERLLRLQEPIRKNHIGAIILSPTRELAAQIYTVLENLLAFHPPSAALLPSGDEDDDDDDDKLGSSNGSGAPKPPTSTSSTELKVVPQLLLGGSATPAQDLSAFLTKSPNLIIATPGRLLDLVSSPHVHCPQSSFQVLIMDEADRLLDLGFQDTLQKILSRLPKQRRTGLFSASMSEAVDQLVRVGLRNPVRVAVRVKTRDGAREKRTPASLAMHYILTQPATRWPAVNSLLTNLNQRPQKTLIYLSTCAAVDYWQHILPAILPSSYSIVPLHGKHPPTVRTRNFARFVDDTAPVILLTTDVAARGLDVPSVDLVIQFDPPADPKTFIHRCGRAGRAGRKGLAVILLNQGREADYVEFLRIRGTPITPIDESLVALSPLHLSTTEEQQEEQGADQEQEEQDKEGTNPTTSRIHQILLSDRAIHDKSQRAFVSWVRAYSSHQSTSGSIFSLHDLDWVSHARGWGLLCLPRMPELKRSTRNSDSSSVVNKGNGDRDLGFGVALENVKYKDAAREKKRVAEAMERSNRSADNESGNGDKGNEERQRNKRRKVQSGRGGRDTVHETEEARAEKAWSRKKQGKIIKDERKIKKESKREKERIGKLDQDGLKREYELQNMIEVVRRQVSEKS